MKKYRITIHKQISFAATRRVLTFLGLIEKFFYHVPDTEDRGECYRSGVFTLPLSDDEVDHLNRMRLVISVEEVE